MTNLSGKTIPGFQMKNQQTKPNPKVCAASTRLFATLSIGVLFTLMLLTIGPALTVAGSPAASRYSASPVSSSSNLKSDNIPTLRWIYGLSFGGYFANPSTANYYNGSGEHSVETALNRVHNRDRLINNVDEIIDTFEVGELPQNMRYNPAMQLGFFGGINFSRSFTVMGEFNYTRLTAADKFTLITDKFTSTSEPYRLLSDIYGVEERIELRLGFQYTLYTDSYIHPFIESGLNITDTKVVENRVTISGIQFNIREIRTDYYNVRDYGMGFGIYTGVGLNFEVSDKLNFRMGGSVSLSQINLGDNNEIKPQYTAFLRLNLNELFSGA